MPLVVQVNEPGRATNPVLAKSSRMLLSVFLNPKFKFYAAQRATSVKATCASLPGESLNRYVGIDVCMMLKQFITDLASCLKGVFAFKVLSKWSIPYSARPQRRWGYVCVCICSLHCSKFQLQKLADCNVKESLKLIENDVNKKEWSCSFTIAVPQYVQKPKGLHLPHIPRSLKWWKGFQVNLKKVSCNLGKQLQALLPQLVGPDPSMCFSMEFPTWWLVVVNN